jgi:CHAT domain-containing protein/tetratricopeptide (TPR) repeat protein
MDQLQKEARRQIELHEDALPNLEAELGPDHLNVATVLHDLATLYVGVREYDRAEQLHQRSLSIRLSVLGPNHPDVAASLKDLAYLYTAMGAYGRAEPLLRRSLAIREMAPGDSMKLAGTRNALAGLYWQMGEYARAIPEYERSLELYESLGGPEDFNLATMLEMLSILYEKNGDYERAEAALKRALAIHEREGGPNDHRLANSLGLLAYLYASRGENERATPFFRRSLALLEAWDLSSVPDDHPSQGILLASRGTLHMALGEYALAEPLLEQSLDILEATLGPDDPMVASVLQKLAILRAAQGRFSSALSLSGRILEIRDNTLRITLGTLSEERQRLYLGQLFSESEMAISLQLKHLPEDSSSVRIAMQAVLTRKGRVLDGTATQLATLRRNLDEEGRRLLDDLSSARSQLANVWLRGPGEDGAGYRSVTARLQEEIARLEASLASRSAEYRTQSAPVTLSRLSSAVPLGSALVELVRYQEYQLESESRRDSWRYGAYIVTGGDVQSIDLGDAAPIEAAVAALRGSLSDPAVVPGSPSRTVYDLVVAPILARTGTAKHLLLAPDGALNLVPFAALTDAAGRPLIEAVTITYLTSGRDLLRLAVEREGRGPDLVVAAPDYVRAGTPEPAPEPSSIEAAVGAAGVRSGDLTLGTWPPLPGTRAEADAISAILSSAVTRLGPAATEGSVKSASAPQILHIATHGFFLDDEPAPSPPDLTRGLGLGLTGPAIPVGGLGENPLLRSGLVLAGADSLDGGEGADGYLTALEVSGLDLWGTELVVLSACETGVGDVANGDGVYGLRRALVLAGAESQLMSLWSVSDEATRNLMVAYYERLMAGEGRSEALRNVQLEMLRNPATSHPFYWASFIPIGDWRPISMTQPNSTR